MTGALRHTILVAAVAVAALTAAGVAAAAERLPLGSEPAQLDPADFTTRIDNPYYPLRPGDVRVYRKVEIDGSRKIVTERVTDRTTLIANGVTARVVHVVDTRRGQVVETTDDWYAQDRAGNVWYLGEDTRFFKDGRPIRRPDSWQAGVDGALPGVIMPAKPRVGQTYRQEYHRGVAQDRAEVLARNQRAETPLRHFRGALLIGESTPLEPEVLDLFLYARGVGAVLAVEVSGGTERLELIRFRRGS